MKTANLAIVFTDIKGFTERTSRQTLEENQRLLEVHARLLTPIFAAFGGRIVKSIGDAFMVTFESPTNAVLCGAAIQDRLWLYNRDAGPSERLDVRVAINGGEVRIENHDVFGEPVNIAARVEAIAEAGEVTFTEAVYLSMNKAEVPAEEIGPVDLKGIPGKVKLFRVPHAPYRVAAPAGEASGESPPFGNIGLARVPPGDGLVERTQRALADAGRGRLTRFARPRVIVPAVLVAGAIAAAAAFLGRSDVDRAIAAARRAPPEEKLARAEAADRLIAAIEDPAERAWQRGRLLEALGREAEAVHSYRNAAARGSSRAVDRMIDLLEHDACAVRSTAAAQLGALKATRARGALEDLALEGGPDDQEGGGVIGAVFGCNSKEAAARALRQLE